MSLYNLEYWIGNRKVETLEYGKPKPLCLYIRKTKKFLSGYQSGKFKLVAYEETK